MNLKQLGKIVLAVIATVGPIVGILFRYWRETRVALAFAAWFVTTHRQVVFAVVGAAVILVIARRAATWFAIDFLPLPFLVRRLSFVAQLVLLAVPVVIVQAVRPYVAVQYRLFSEVSYPAAALDAWTRGDRRLAAERCEEYIALFPQRAPNGTAADPICQPILRATREYQSLLSYLRRQRPGAKPRFDQPGVGGSRELRTAAMQFLLEESSSERVAAETALASAAGWE